MKNARFSFSVVNCYPAAHFEADDADDVLALVEQRLLRRRAAIALSKCKDLSSSRAKKLGEQQRAAAQVALKIQTKLRMLPTSRANRNQIVTPSTVPNYHDEMRRRMAVDALEDAQRSNGHDDN